MRATQAKVAPSRQLRNLHPSAEIGAVLHRLIQDAASARRMFLESGTPEAVHELRRVLRRLCAIFHLAARLLAPGDGRFLQAELTWMAKQLSGLRDIDVLEARLAVNVDWTGGTIDEDALIGWFTAERREAAESAKAKISGARADFLFAGICAFTEHHAGKLGGPGVTDQLLMRVKQQLEGALRNGQKILTMNPARRHHFRSQVKRLRYYFEALPSHVAPNDPLTSAVAQLHAVLGDMNDDAVGQRLVETMRRSKKLRKLHHQRLRAGAKQQAELKTAWQQFQIAAIGWLKSVDSVRAGSTTGRSGGKPRGRSPAQ